MNQTAVIFDFGDTLYRIVSFDFAKGQAALAARLGREDELGDLEEAGEAVRYLFEERDDTSLEIDLQKYLRLCIELAGWTHDLDGFQIELTFWKAAADLELFPGVPEALRDLKEVEGHPLGVITNAAFSEELNRYPLRQSGIERYFDTVISSCDYGVRKPARFLFDIATNHLDRRNESAIYVGNSIEFDVVGARNAGLQAILFDPHNEHPDFDGPRFSSYDNLVSLVREMSGE